MSTLTAKQGLGDSGTRVIKAGSVAVLELPAVKPEPPPAQKPAPHVRLIKEGDVVKSIEIQCGCGEIIRLDCEY